MPLHQSAGTFSHFRSGVYSRARLVVALLVCGVFTAATIGCGSRMPERVTVSGQVMIDGKPLTCGSISLVPKDARPSTGAIDEHGRFTLTCYGGKDGAIKGHHAVRVVASKPLPGDAIRWLAPPKYADHRTSGLGVDIDGPTDSLRIDLTWGGGAPFVEQQKK
jgi:hypothetical protein